MTPSRHSLLLGAAAAVLASLLLAGCAGRPDYRGGSEVPASVYFGWGSGFGGNRDWGGGWGGGGAELNTHGNPTGSPMAADRPARIVTVWDLPTRVFHWALVLLVGASWAAVSLNWMELHFVLGYSVAALLLFRLAWGLVGSDTARFARFLHAPSAAFHHLTRIARREPDREVGHNAAGGWMVLVMLLLLLVQAGTGLSANDDVMLEGPFAKYVGKTLSDQLTRFHKFNFSLVEAAVVLHVAAILVYALFKRQDLVRPMVTGRKRLPDDVPAPSLLHPAWAVVLLVAAIAVVTFVVNWT